MDNGWGEGGFGEMMGPRENTFPKIKLGLGEKMCLQGWTFCGEKKVKGEDVSPRKRWLGRGCGWG